MPDLDEAVFGCEYPKVNVPRDVRETSRQASDTAYVQNGNGRSQLARPSNRYGLNSVARILVCTRIQYKRFMRWLVLTDGFWFVREFNAKSSSTSLTHSDLYVAPIQMNNEVGRLTNGFGFVRDPIQMDLEVARPH